jgi:hypothetical protein
MVPVPTTDGKATEMVYRYYHWRCSEADILGGEEVGAVVETGDSPPQEFSEYMTVGPNDAVEEHADEPKTVEKYTMDNKPECYTYFDGDDSCMEPDCDDIRTACAMEAGYAFVNGEYVKKPKKKKEKA